MTTVVRKGIKWKNTKTVINEDVSAGVDLDAGNKFTGGSLTVGGGSGTLSHAIAFIGLPTDYFLRITSYESSGEAINITNAFSADIGVGSATITVVGDDGEYSNVAFDFGEVIDTIEVDNDGSSDTGIRSAFWQYQAVAKTGGTQVKRGFINACWNANTAGSLAFTEFGQVGTAPALQFKVYSKSAASPYEVKLVAFVLDGYTYDIKLIRQVL